jgi:hypothetical protein
VRRFREAACWAHWRRDFHDIWASNKSEIARQALDRIGALYDIERDIAGLLICTDGLDAPPTGIAVCQDGDALRHLQRRRHPWKQM